MNGCHLFTRHIKATMAIARGPCMFLRLCYLLLHVILIGLCQVNKTHTPTPMVCNTDINMLKLKESSNFTYLGCFELECPNPDDYTFNSTRLDIDNCTQECQGMGYTQAALTRGETCHCRFIVPLSSPGPPCMATETRKCDRECGFPCSGNLFTLCGGKHTYQLYDVNIKASTPRVTALTSHEQPENNTGALYLALVKFGTPSIVPFALVVTIIVLLRRKKKRVTSTLVTSRQMTTLRPHHRARIPPTVSPFTERCEDNHQHYAEISPTAVHQLSPRSLDSSFSDTSSVSQSEGISAISSPRPSLAPPSDDGMCLNPYMDMNRSYFREDGSTCSSVPERLFLPSATHSLQDDILPNAYIEIREGSSPLQSDIPTNAYMDMRGSPYRTTYDAFQNYPYDVLSFNQSKRS